MQECDGKQSKNIQAQYMNLHTFEKRRKIRRHDRPSQYYSQIIILIIIIIIIIIILIITIIIIIIFVTQ